MVRFEKKIWRFKGLPLRIVNTLQFRWLQQKTSKRSCNKNDGQHQTVMRAKRGGEQEDLPKNVGEEEHEPEKLDEGDGESREES